MRKLDIGGHKYSVKFMDGEKAGEGNKYLFGMNNPRTNEIYLDEKLVTSRRNETFLHEIIHVILVNTGCDHDEGLIESLANGFHQLGVGEYLWKKVEK
jgi:Zn-dependent peptidase ImmA (M78 family)